MSNQKEKAADYFKRYKTSSKCFITSDGRVFHNAGSASGFANTLKDDKVATFKRSAFNVADVKEAKDVKKLNVSGSIYETANFAEITKRLETLELESANYQEMKVLVKFFELEVADQKAETLIEALTAYKLKIQD